MAKLAVGTLAVLCAIAAYGIGSGRYLITVLVAAIVVIPVALIVALRRPYLFPFGLYVALVPFDNLLLLGSSGTLTKILGIASGAVIAVSLLRRRSLVRPSRSLWLWFAFILWLSTTLLWTQDVPQGQRAALQIASIVLLFAILALAPLDERELRTVCACIMFGGAAAALYGIYLFHNPAFHYDPTGTGRLMIDVGGRRIDPNHFANSLLLPFSLAIVGVLRARRAVWVVLFLAGVVSIGSGIVLTASREALIAAVLVLGVIVLFSRRRVLATAIAISGMVTALFFFPLILQRFQEGVAQQGDARNYVWHVVWLSFQQHPSFGWGIGSGIAAYNANYLAVSAPTVSYWDMSPHNTVLYVMLELGVVGGVLWLSAYCGTYLQMLEIHSGDSLYDLRVALTAAFVGMSFVMLFIDLMDYKYLWLLLGTIAQLRSVARLRAAARSSEPSLAEPATTRRAYPPRRRVAL